MPVGNEIYNRLSSTWWNEQQGGFTILRTEVNPARFGYFREVLMLCDLCPNVYLDTSSSNSWMHYEELDLRTVFRRALEVVGPNRLLFGTDSSFFPRGWNAQIYEAQCTALYEVGLKIETARLIFHDNFSRLFAAFVVSRGGI